MNKKRKFEFNKLVRNKLPTRMQEEGVRVSQHSLSSAEYIVKLKLKLIEEAEEVKEANSLEELKRELADVMEVILTLAENSGLTMADIEQERINKREINGYFNAENYISSIEVDENDRQLIEYLEQKNRGYHYKKA